MPKESGKRQSLLNSPEREEPEELRLWRQVARHRDILAEEIVRYEAGTHPRVDSLREMGMNPESVSWMSTYLAGEAAKVLARYDDKIRALRSGAGANYALSKLKLFLDEYRNNWLRMTHHSVVEHLNGHESTVAQAFLSFIASFDGPKILDISGMLKRAIESPEFDIQSIDREARVWCNTPSKKSGEKSRYETPTNRAFFIVAVATGWSPSDPGGGLSPDQVKARIKNAEPI